MSRRTVGFLLLGWSAIFLALFLIQEANFLLFHGLAELFSIVIAGGVFLVAWNSRHRLEDNFLLLIGIGYAFVGGLDALHMLAYAGMGVFPDEGGNLATQLWLAARYLESVTILGALAVAAKPGLHEFGSGSRDDFQTWVLFLGYAVVALTMVVAIFTATFPTSFVEGSGLTPFKIYSEYVIIGLLLAALGLLYRTRATFEPHIYRYLALSIVLTIAAEFAFTQYVGVYDLSNTVGHLLKIASFYLIYLAVIKTGISAPQELLFRRLSQERDKLAQREQELERTNQQLEEFASIVSHDLRNPLSVASGRLELAREEHDSEDLERVAQAHERMSLLIDDLLTLARSGDLASERESIDLRSLVETTWEHVRTADATLVVETDRQVSADRSRLQQLLENLFRNAVDHGDSGVTVTVGELEDGFYIADDGPGIPDSAVTQIFSAGYSTDSEGTGFGLSIVQQVVEAHGWTIEVTESETGGARFEIRGVEFATE